MYLLGLLLLFLRTFLNFVENNYLKYFEKIVHGLYMYFFDRLIVLDLVEITSITLNYNDILFLKPFEYFEF